MEKYNDFYKQYPGYNGDSGIPSLLPCEYALHLLNEKRDGFFIDVGAHDGIAWSNSLIFEKLFNWKGICIEGNPNLFKKLTNNRTSKCFNYVIDKDKSEQIFWSIDGSVSGLGGLERGFLNNHEERINHELKNDPNSVCNKISVVPVTLDEIILSENIKYIDYLSIDVEGNELGVLESCNFDNIECKVISVESNDRNSVEKYLLKYGYKILNKICADDFYMR